MKKAVILILTISWGYLSHSQTLDTNYDTQKKRIVKMEFFSPLTGNTTFGYEQYIKDWISWEAKVGIIGWGTDNEDVDPKGILFRGGPKFKLNPDFVTRDLRGSHLLSGKYIRPEIVFSTYTEDAIQFTSSGDQRTRESFTSFAFLINYGRQFVLADVMSLDWHIGIGYGSNSSGTGKYHFSHSAGDSDFPVAVSAGFTIGVLIR